MIPHQANEKICEEVFDAIAMDIGVDGFRFSAPAESPIEEIFGAAAWAWCKYIDHQELILWSAEKFDAACLALAEKGTDKYSERFVLATNQFQIEQMRVDFCFAGQNWRTGKVFRLITECDGHDFHERTKAQACNDRSRDRSLQERGYNVFRFTGSEIWRRPMRCVEQVFDWLDRKSCEDDP